MSERLRSAPLLEILQRSVAWLERRGIESPRLDVELLMAHALGCRRLDLYLQFERPLDAAEIDRIRELITRRADARARGVPHGPARLSRARLRRR